MNKKLKAETAKKTLEILEQGYYFNKSGKKIDISEALSTTINSSKIIQPSMLEDISSELEGIIKITDSPIIEITNETTLSACRRITKEFERTVCLNFASAKHPGGGFRSGSIAQEESLAIASGLYPSISRMKEMYEYNKRLKTKLYSDYMIYSPNVPFFRDDNDILLDETFQVSIITAPAVNKGALSPSERGLIDKTMVQRIRKIIVLAILQGNDSIILGAYGCGVFKNQAIDVARYFYDVLIKEKYFQYFRKVSFAIFERSKDKPKLNTFRKVFG